MGEVVQLGGQQSGGYRGRGGWLISPQEDEALDYLPHGDQVLYIRALRRFMDYSTGVVGVRRRLSYQGLAELLEVHRLPGSTVPAGRPSLQQIRSMISRLEGRGLVVPVPQPRFAGLVFRLPLALVSEVCQDEQQHQSSTRAATPENQYKSNGCDLSATPEQRQSSNTHQVTGLKLSNKLDSSESGDSADVDRVVGVGACPHALILEIWCDVFRNTGVSMPKPNLWPGSQGATWLKARWQQAAGIDHSKRPGKLYHDRESGLLWWRSFFEFLRDQCGAFLLSDDSRFFDLHWIVKKSNFEKALGGKYRNR